MRESPSASERTQQSLCSKQVVLKRSIHLTSDMRGSTDLVNQDRDLYAGLADEDTLLSKLGNQ